MRLRGLSGVVKAACIALAAFLATVAVASADGPEMTAVDIDDLSPFTSRSGFPNLDSNLGRLVSQQASIPQGAASFRGTTVAVQVRFQGDAGAIVGFLQANGARIASIGPGFIEADVPVSLLQNLSQRPGVVGVDPILRPEALVTSQGTVVHRSPVWNSGGFTGSGIKVGVIDVGFSGFTGLMGTELPSSVVARCYIGVGVFTLNVADCANGEVHGTAVAEAVMDMAPGATLYIANPQSTTDLNSVAAWMASEGVKVINHSVAWSWQGPGDGTSPFTNAALAAINTAVAGGAVWVNSAGNHARATWSGPFLDTDSDGAHEFSLGPFDETNDFFMSVGSRVVVQLRWNDSWTNASKDVDLYLIGPGGTLVASSEWRQTGAAGNTPFEIIVYTAPTTGTYQILVLWLSGPAPATLQLQMLTQQALQYWSAPSITNPADSASPGMLTVGAAAWNTTTVIETFSSQGPTTDSRIKPDIVGADRGDSVTYGAGGFAGTSQSAPHVTGLAALVLQRFPSFTPAQVVSYLKTNSLPRDTVPNNTWGYGFAQLPSLPPGSPTGVSATAGTGKATVQWTAPSFNGGSAITGYFVTSTPGAITRIVGSGTASTTVDGLTPGTSYTFVVAAFNSA
ncbi:MAG: hypothetical protein FJ317_04300, partial [SAR202 cluster bacterium]|nr:hypothetical protein [SAR202 cluster bacterium]